MELNNKSNYKDQYQEEDPDYVWVSGLPLMLCGWNQKLKKIKLNQYELDKYNLFYILPIRPILLVKNGDWVLMTNDSQPQIIGKRISDSDDFVFYGRGCCGVYQLTGTNHKFFISMRKTSLI